MTTLKGLGLSFTLICVLMVTAFAGETPGPPCIPGETGSPPCSQSLTDGSTNPGETGTPPVSNSVDITTIAETAFWSLSLF